LLLRNLSTNRHTCETMAYAASEVLGNELNKSCCVHSQTSMPIPLKIKDYNFKTHANALFIFS